MAAAWWHRPVSRDLAGAAKAQSISDRALPAEILKSGDCSRARGLRHGSLHFRAIDQRAYHGHEQGDRLVIIDR